MSIVKFGIVKIANRVFLFFVARMFKLVEGLARLRALRVALFQMVIEKVFRPNGVFAPLTLRAMASRRRNQGWFAHFVLPFAASCLLALSARSSYLLVPLADGPQRAGDVVHD